ncbi:hypothetical protein BXZ70DRAFT_523022 [Cristinia sonorae]|uniref:F-box domain-containing protein n=1 Tax=Cristinia sonorae TaxID=1940300 RepID=A0A8K0XTM0_9AGAR|nr:hypothetical protein BXZ70DRAFT_523022 [Cristinia sonorae]
MNVNLDVLTEIFSHLTAVEALAFSTACRAVYSVVIPLVLRDVSVHLGTDIHRVNQFISFALKDGENRPNLIQHFQLNGTPYFQDGDGQTKLRTDQREDLDEVGLTEVLLQAQNIQNLHLDSPEFLLTRCPRVAVALQRCKFRHLTFSWAVGPVTIDALCSMHHSPRKLALLAPTLRTPEIISVTPGTIHTESWKFSAVSDTMVLSAKTVFPHARRLQWFESVVTLSVLAHSFPNIDKLEFRGSRLTSERRQDCWRRLDYFKGLLDDFKNVFEHASISVRHLDFDYVMPVRNYDAEDWDVCTAAVRIASPSVLFLPLSPIDNQVVPLRFRQASRSLKCLKVMLYFLLAEDVEQWIRASTAYPWSLSASVSCDAGGSRPRRRSQRWRVVWQTLCHLHPSSGFIRNTMTTCRCGGRSSRTRRGGM